jgi:hypothetical protein
MAHWEVVVFITILFRVGHAGRVYYATIEGGFGDVVFVPLGSTLGDVVLGRVSLNWQYEISSIKLAV